MRLSFFSQWLQYSPIQSMRNKIVWGILLFLFAAFSVAAGPATTQSVDLNKQMESWWEDLQKSEPWCSRALLDFYDHPTQSVAFFKSHLKPLKIEETDLDDALQALASDDTKIWKPAFEKLEYLDPRLNRSVETLLDSVTDSTARSRLAALLTNTSADQWKDCDITYSKNGNWAYLSMSKGNNGRSMYGVQNNVSQISKSSWTRCERALVLLQRIGTPDAIQILNQMADANPAAQTTQIAKAALESLKTAAK